MIRKLTVHISQSTNPYENLATEEYLTFHTEPDECILFFWQNAHTVVIGRNQNCWKECRVTELEADGGHLARRLSGGGAVYHDLGNLNFTFCLRKEEADVNKQLQVLINAVAKFGLTAEKSGRNDAVISDRKFSGNAFYDSQGYYYHHGCILIGVDPNAMARYLNPSKAKLESKGVDSVRARVVNLAHLCPQITVSTFKGAMIKAFEEVYGFNALTFDVKRLDGQKIKEITTRLNSWEWKYGQKISFTDRINHRFTWGEVELALKVKSGIICEALLSSDTMEYRWFEGIGKQLADCRYEASSVYKVLCPLLLERHVPESVIKDLQVMLQKEI